MRDEMTPGDESGETTTMMIVSSETVAAAPSGTVEVAMTEGTMTGDETEVVARIAIVTAGGIGVEIAIAGMIATGDDERLGPESWVSCIHDFVLCQIVGMDCIIVMWHLAIAIYPLWIEDTNRLSDTVMVMLSCFTL
jgi:hypothetical protein